MRFDWNNPYPSYRLPVHARNVVSTSHPLAAQAGLRMLWQGGNAIDAIVATAATLTIVEPCSNGLGSDAFALVWDGTRLHGINGSGPAPAAWSLDYFRRKYGSADGRIAAPRRGWDAVTVPGAIGTWEALHTRFGKLPFADVLQPAIEFAERGYGITHVVAYKWALAVRELAEQPGFAEHFMPHGRALAEGELFRFPAAATTLRRLAAAGARDFYEGETAATMLAHCAAAGGAMTAADLRDFRPEWVEPLGKRYRGYTLHEIPPNGQGIAALIALGILQQFDVRSLPVDSIESQHLQIEAMKLAFADVYRYVSDPRSMECTSAEMLDDTYLAQRAELIDMTRATPHAHGMPGRGGTVYLTAADESGMMVSFIQSNYLGFGSGVVVPGAGISMQNRGVGFSMEAGSPNVVAGGKKPFHTIVPAFLTKDGDAVMSFGVMGGEMQPQGHMQTVVRMLDYGQNPQAACDAPRWKINRDGSVDIEPTMPESMVRGLRAKGHRVQIIDNIYQDFGAGQFIWRMPDTGYVAASDARRDGCAAAF
jgi:gamma-glutamyltranspeptidase/glutathione hydrolase